MKLVKTASGKMSVKISKSDWITTGRKHGWLKEAQVAPQQGAPVAGQGAASQGNPQVMTFNGIMKQYPDIAKSYQVVSSGEKTKRILRYQLEQLGVNWQSMPEFIELLG